MEADERIERLLTDVRVKGEQLLVDDEDARHAGVSDGSLPSLDCDDGLEKDHTTQTEAWKQVKLQARLEFEKSVLEHRKKYFQTLLRHSVINRWIEDNTGLKGGMDFSLLRSTIESHIDADRIPALKLYLNDVLTHGMKIAEKNVKHRRTGGWTSLGYTLTAAKGFVYVAAVLAILSVAESSFEKVALVVLILIGNAANGQASHVRVLFVEVHETLDKQFAQLRRFFKLPEREDEREARYETRATADMQLTRGGIKYIIQTVFEGIVWLICAAELVRVLIH